MMKRIIAYTKKNIQGERKEKKIQPPTILSYLLWRMTTEALRNLPRYEPTKRRGIDFKINPEAHLQ